MTKAKNVEKRLLACGYGYSMYPPSWWSEEELQFTEKACKELKGLPTNEWVKKFTEKRQKWLSQQKKPSAKEVFWDAVAENNKRFEEDGFD